MATAGFYGKYFLLVPYFKQSLFTKLYKTLVIKKSWSLRGVLNATNKFKFPNILDKIEATRIRDRYEIFQIYSILEDYSDNSEVQILRFF